MKRPCYKWLLLGAVSISFSFPVMAGTPYERRMTCPVGGETFTFTDTGSYSTLGSRPDGKPYGSWIFPLPIPECPGNRLVIYREFRANELDRIADLLASAEYAALGRDTPYYRAQWLATRLDANDRLRPLWLLHRASWQADREAARKTVYQTEFARRAGEIVVEPAVLDTLFLRFYAANALRELARFDEALAALDSLPLAAPTPQSSDSDFAAEEDRKSREHLAHNATLLRDEIARQNRSSEPLRMIPQDMAAYRCADAIESAGTIDLYCRSETLAEPVSEAREMIKKRAQRR